MGTVAVLFRVYTEAGKEEAVRQAVIDTLKPRGSQIEDVAFGIKTLKFLFMHDDAQGSSQIEEAIRKIPGVNEVEVIEETLM